MRCRCTDIEQERSKYNRLQTQAERLARHAGYQTDLEQDVINMKMTWNSCIQDAVPYGLLNRLHTITDDSEPLRKQLNTKIAQKMENVRSNISGMQSEDSAWHEEQERIAEEQRRQAEARLRQQQKVGICLR